MIHPLDFDALQKGQVIPRLVLERIFGFSQESKPAAYSFAVMGLIQHIERERQDLVCRGANGFDIRIMHDAEACEYLHARLEQCAASIRRISGKRARIDTSQFTDTQKRISDSQDRTAQGLALVTHKAMSAGRRELLLLESEEKAKEIEASHG